MPVSASRTQHAAQPVQVHGLSDSVEYQASSVKRWPGRCEVPNRKGRGAVRHAKPPTSTRVFGLDSAPFSLPPHYARTLACTLSRTHVHTRTQADTSTSTKKNTRGQTGEERVSFRLGAGPGERPVEGRETAETDAEEGRLRRARGRVGDTRQEEEEVVVEDGGEGSTAISQQRAASGVDGGVCRSGAALRGGGGGERGLISPCVVLRGWHPPPPSPGPYPFFKLPMSLPVPSPLPASLPLSEWAAGAYRIVGMGLNGAKVARGVGSHGWRTDHGQSRDKDEWPAEYGIETCRQRLASGRDSFRP